MANSPAKHEIADETDTPTINILRPVNAFSEANPFVAMPNAPCVRGYEILSEIGSGGMGIVYKARHRNLNRIIALKTLRGVALADPAFRERFRAEAEAVARLQHPNIIQVFEIGVAEALPGAVRATPFIALEFVDGGSLARQTDRPQPPRYAAEIVEKLARAVDVAHRLGVVHRDLKPANVLLSRDGEPKIADFGLAKQLEAERDAAGRFVTQAGMVMGTPEYMSPEQAAGETPTAAIDIYALGVILYELLTARVPFQGATPGETMTLAREQEPIALRRLQPSLPRNLDTICMKCLEKLPGKRYASAQALADDLRRFLDGRTILARRASEVEKVVRWCRRNPLVATSVAGIVGTVLVAFALVSRSNWQLETALHNEAAQRQEAEGKKQSERWERYRANITATASLFHVNDASGARRSLQASPEDHRNWEWHHFNSRTDLAQRVIDASKHNPRDGHRMITGDGGRMVLFGLDDPVRLIDTTTGHIVEKPRPTPGIKGQAISRDGKLLVYPVGNDAIELWDLETDRVRRILHGHGQAPHKFDLSVDGRRLMTTLPDQTVRVWETATGRCLAAFRPYHSNLDGASLSPNGRRVAVHNDATQEIGIWDADTGTLVSTLASAKSSRFRVYFNHGATRLVTADRFPCNELHLWNAESGQLLRTMTGHENTVLHCAFSGDEARIATCSMDQTIRLWDGLTGRSIAVLKGHIGWVNALAFSPDNKRLVSGSQDHTVRLWDGRTGAPVNVLPGHNVDVEAVRYAPDGKRIVSLSGDAVVRCWATRLLEYDGILRGHTKMVYGVAYHPDGRRVASCSWDGTVRVWDSGTGQQLSLLDHGKDVIVVSVAIHPDGKMLASRTREAVSLWDLGSGREVHRWNTPSDPWRHTRLAFSPRGDLLASGGTDRKIHLWDVKSRAEVCVFQEHKDVVRDVAFSPDGRWLVSAGEAGDKTIRVWSLASKRQVKVLEAHTGCVYSLGFNADGTILASGSLDGTARLWNTATWEEIAVLKHGTNVYGVAFTPDGTRLACACANNAIRLWDMATYQEVVDLRGHGAYAHAVVFSPDGSRLVSCSGDCTVRVWDTIRPQERIPER